MIPGLWVSSRALFSGEISWFREWVYGVRLRAGGDGEGTRMG